MSELKPCPFCAGLELIVTDFGITCQGCHTQVCGSGVDGDEVAWNRRPSTEGPGEWRGIESAPVNEQFLAYRPDAGVFAARWCYLDHEDDPVLFTAEGEDLTGDLPTHWMPLPAPPAVSALPVGGRGGDDRVQSPD